MKLIQGIVATFLVLFSSVYGGSGDVESLCERLLEDRAADFSFVQEGAEDEKDYFSVEAKGGKVKVTGNSGVSMASGLHWYLKNVTHCNISWNGDQLRLPAVLPDAEVVLRSPYDHGFYFNYCTFSYTMAWWDWERWEREIDFMALNGIDMPLAITGSEALWLNFLKRFGYSDDDAKAFICGPAYNAWWLMGNLEGRGGPVTDEWIESRVVLQRKILKRMRELGMRPMLPGFVGLVPSNTAEKIKGAVVLDQGLWAGPNQRPAVLSPDQPLFDEMAKAWYEEQEKLYGHCDVFAGDLFHEGGKTHGIDVGKLAAKVQGYMIDHDPESIWVIQGWGHNPTKSMLSSLKRENVHVLELCNEFWRNWEKKDGFWGAPWSFSTIIMYGGNTSMHGRLDNIASNLKAAKASGNPPSSLGATWESIEINPVIMDYIWDQRWRGEVPDTGEWLDDYSHRRYGVDNESLRLAWSKLRQTAYGAHAGLRRPQESVFCARPGMKVTKASPFAATTKVHYNNGEMLEVARLMHSAAGECGDLETYQYDLVDVTRQFLTNSGELAYRKMMEAFRAKDEKAFRRFSSDFLAMIEDQDRLLLTQRSCMVGVWLDEARKVAPSEEQRVQNEHAARLLITTWTEESTMLDNYSWREWNGLLKRYYLPQWKMFIDDLSGQLGGKSAKKVDYYSFRKRWAAQTWASDSYATEPEGDVVVESKRVLDRWGAWFAENDDAEEARGRESYVGSWEYEQENVIWRRTLHEDGSLSLSKGGRIWGAWDGFTWRVDGGRVVLLRKDKSQFGVMELQGPGKASFTGGFSASRVETGKNTEADEIAD